MRTAVRGYRSAGFDAELEHARAALEAAGIALCCDAKPLHVPVSQENVLALALREAITNIVRHSAARSCHVQLVQDQQYVELDILDDGKGSAANEGFGLSGMRERIEAMGGALVRDGSQGMRLLIRLPLAATSGAA